MLVTNSPKNEAIDILLTVVTWSKAILDETSEVAFDVLLLSHSGYLGVQV